MVAWLSLVVSIVAIGLTVWESRKRKDADVREERRRDEELEILRDRLDNEERRAQEELQARLVSEVGPMSERPGDVGYQIRIRNLGKGAAEEVNVWLAEWLPGDILSGPCTHIQELGTILPLDEPKVAILSLEIPEGTGHPRSGRVVAYWKDGTGERRDVAIGRVDLKR